MYAPVQRSDEEVAEMQGGRGRVMEADGLAPVYELAETEERGGDAHSLSITIVVAAQAFPVF
jgi:hypothetical protein